MIDKQSALGLMRQATDCETASFREGQWEAIDKIVNHRQRLLVVERTGWGKSTVYFTATAGKAPPLIIALSTSRFSGYITVENDQSSASTLCNSSISGAP